MQGRMEKAELVVMVGRGHQGGGRVTKWAFHCSEHGWAQDAFPSRKAAEKAAVSHRGDHG